MTIKKCGPFPTLKAFLACVNGILHSAPSLAEPSWKITHVPISHATLQCTATPTTSMRPQPNPSSLSMVASRLAKGMGRNEVGEVKNGEKRKGTELQTEKQ